MARISHALVGCHRPAELVIEGGATAFAILNRLGWNSFTITEEIAPGVIRMQADNGTHVTMKPGSLPRGATYSDNNSDDVYWDVKYTSSFDILTFKNVTFISSLHGPVCDNFSGHHRESRNG